MTAKNTICLWFDKDAEAAARFYAETFRSSLRLRLPDGRQRSASTAIHYLLPPGAWSTWHRVRSDEVWHHYDGGALRLYRLGQPALRLDRETPQASR